MQWIVLTVIVSYLIGAIPTAYIVGKLVKGIDIRRFGSGNVGATNTVRVLGKGWGALVLIIDIAKGIIPVVLISDYAIFKNSIVSESLLRMVTGIAAVCGHNWTIFLGFKGGKGVATTLGVLLGLALRIPGVKIIFALTLLTWLIIFLIFRLVSLASIFSVISLPVFMFLYKQPRELMIMSVILCVFVIWRHKPNIIKLLHREEKPFRK